MTNDRRGGRLSAADEEAYSEWAARIEADDFVPDAASITGDKRGTTESSRAMLADLIGEERVAEAERKVGRPSLSGSASSGESPVRRFRLTRELNAELEARAEREHRKPSALIREAVEQYLRKAS